MKIFSRVTGETKNRYQVIVIIHVLIVKKIVRKEIKQPKNVSFLPSSSYTLETSNFCVQRLLNRFCGNLTATAA